MTDVTNRIVQKCYVDVRPNVTGRFVKRVHVWHFSRQLALVTKAVTGGCVSSFSIQMITIRMVKSATEPMVAAMQQRFFVRSFIGIISVLSQFENTILLDFPKSWRLLVTIIVIYPNPSSRPLQTSILIPFPIWVPRPCSSLVGTSLISDS
jgi:hypothetical protein